MINFSSYIKSQNKDLTLEQENNIKESENYIEKHKLNQLFNVINLMYKFNRLGTISPDYLETTRRYKRSLKI